MQTSKGYIFRILQHFVTKFCNFTNFNKFFTGKQASCLLSYLVLAITSILKMRMRLMIPQTIDMFISFIAVSLRTLDERGRRRTRGDAILDSTTSSPCPRAFFGSIRALLRF